MRIVMGMTPFKHMLLIILSATLACSFSPPITIRLSQGNKKCASCNSMGIKMSIVSEHVARRQALAWLIVGGGSIASQAAVPTMEEYNVGSGTVVRFKGEAKKVVERPKPTDLVTLRLELSDATTSLKELKELVDKRAWDNVRGMLQQQTVSQKFIKPDRPRVIYDAYGGFESAGAMSKACGVTAAQVKAFEKARKDTSQLADFAFTNRVLFFNEEDKKTVSRLETNLEVDLEEAKGYVQVAAESLAEMINALQ